MTYQLGIDLGTTYTAAAIHRDDRSTIFSLGGRAASIPSVVLLREDETVLTGEAAVRRAFTEPERVAREFKRRLGDTTPIIVGGSPYSAEALMARLLRSVVDEVQTREGEPPERITISHPANWGQFKIDLLRQAVTLANLDSDAVSFITEPEAAAISYASQERVEPGAVVAVYDLGGGTFDAAMLRRTEAGFEIIGKPEGIERLGGIDFDAAVFAHVTRALDGALEQLDPDDASAVAAVARLRHDCVDAKEALSSDTDATIPVLLPNVQTEVRITRREFEALIRPSLVDSIEAMRRAVRSAGLETSDVASVLLVGGSSRVPLIAQLVSSELGRPVAVDAHPKHAVALGAAYFAAADTGQEMAAPPAAEPEPAPAAPEAAVPEPAAPQAVAPPPLVEEPPPAAPPSVPVVEAEIPPAADVARPEAEPTVAVPAVDPTTVVPAQAAPAAPVHSEPPPRLVESAPAAPAAAAPTAAAAAGSMATGGAAGDGDQKKKAVFLGALAGVALALAIGGFLLFTGDDGDAAADESIETSDSTPDTSEGDGSDDTDSTDGTGSTDDTTPEVTVSDEELEAAAASAIGLITDGVEVEANGGVVRVAGKVFDEAVRDDVLEAAGAVEGVVAVDPELTVQTVDERCTPAMKANVRYACITEATFDGTTIRAVLDTDPGPAPFSTADKFHMHIFGSNIDPITAGANGDASNGDPSGTWVVWDDPEQFESQALASLFGSTEVAEKLCVRIATAIHTLDSLDVGNCWPIEIIDPE